MQLPYMYNIFVYKEQVIVSFLTVSGERAYIAK